MIQLCVQMNVGWYDFVLQNLKKPTSMIFSATIARFFEVQYYT